MLKRHRKAQVNVSGPTLSLPGLSWGVVLVAVDRSDLIECNTLGSTISQLEIILCRLCDFSAS